MIDFYQDAILYLIIYIYFNIWIFTKYNSKILKVFSLMVQLSIIGDIIINISECTSILSNIYFDLLIFISLFSICGYEIYKDRSDY